MAVFSENDSSIRACWIQDNYNQLGAVHLVGFPSSCIQRVLKEILHNVSLYYQLVNPCAKHAIFPSLEINGRGALDFTFQLPKIVASPI